MIAILYLSSNLHLINIDIFKIYVVHVGFNINLTIFFFKSKYFLDHDISLLVYIT
jgi:hypothetical protein